MTTATKIQFNEMTEFVIDEISGVDQPAVVGARATIMKRNGIGKDFGDYTNPRMTSAEEGHQHMLDDTSRGGETSYAHSEDEEHGHTHPWIKNDDQSITIGQSDGHTHTVLDKRAPQSAGDPGSGPDGGNPMAEKTEAEKAAAAVEKRIKDAEDRAERAEKLASLNDAERAHFAKLSDEDSPAFLELDAAGRQAAIQKVVGDDPVVYEADDGTEFRKSDDVRLVKMARERDEDRRDLAAEKAARRNETFEKRAKDELGNLPGEDIDKVALLRAVDTIAEAQRPKVLEILKAANTGVTKAFDEAGVSGDGGSSDAEEKLEAMAQKRMTDNEGMTYAKAYTDVITSPEGRELYRESKRQSA